MMAQSGLERRLIQAAQAAPDENQTFFNRKQRIGQKAVQHLEKEKTHGSYKHHPYRRNA